MMLFQDHCFVCSETGITDTARYSSLVTIAFWLQVVLCYGIFWQLRLNLSQRDGPKVTASLCDQHFAQYLEEVFVCCHYEVSFLAAYQEHYSSLESLLVLIELLGYRLACFKSQTKNQARRLSVLLLMETMAMIFSSSLASFDNLFYPHSDSCQKVLARSQSLASMGFLYLLMFSSDYHKMISLTFNASTET